MSLKGLFINLTSCFHMLTFVFIRGVVRFILVITPQTSKFVPNIYSFDQQRSICRHDANDFSFFVRNHEVTLSCQLVKCEKARQMIKAFAVKSSEVADSCFQRVRSLIHFQVIGEVW